jgi:niacin transporter
MIKNTTQRLTVSGFLLALGIILPYVMAHGAGVPGTVLLPMHIPVLLCGFICGPLYGAICGALLPLLNCLLTGMPSLFPMLPIMICELTVYGLSSGLIFNKTGLGKRKLGILTALPLSMICGRAAYTGAFYLILLFIGDFKALSVTMAVVTGLPGIIIQLIIIPEIIIITEKIISKKHKPDKEG